MNGEEIDRHEFEATYDVHVGEGIYAADTKFRAHSPGVSIFNAGTRIVLEPG